MVGLFEIVLELPRYRDEFQMVSSFLGFGLGLRAGKSAVLRALEFTKTEYTVTYVF